MCRVLNGRSVSVNEFVLSRFFNSFRPVTFTGPHINDIYVRNQFILDNTFEGNSLDQIGANNSQQERFISSTQLSRRKNSLPTPNQGQLMSVRDQRTTRFFEIIPLSHWFWKWPLCRIPFSWPELPLQVKVTDISQQVCRNTSYFYQILRPLKGVLKIPCEAILKKSK